jgi:hypothetical protein
MPVVRRGKTSESARFARAVDERNAISFKSRIFFRTESRTDLVRWLRLNIRRQLLVEAIAFQTEAGFLLVEAGHILFEIASLEHELPISQRDIARLERQRRTLLEEAEKCRAEAKQRMIQAWELDVEK